MNITFVFVTVLIALVIFLLRVIKVSTDCRRVERIVNNLALSILSLEKHNTRYLISLRKNEDRVECDICGVVLRKDKASESCKLEHRPTFVGMDVMDETTAVKTYICKKCKK